MRQILRSGFNESGSATLHSFCEGGIVPELNKVPDTDGRSVKAEINVSRHLEGSVRLAMAVLFRFSILK
jgi:hypothetical protein